MPSVPFDSPTVTIGLPTRNSMRFLKQRIDSIKAQTISAWEVVAVDGDSSDGTWSYLKEWAAQDGRVRCEQQRPMGIYPAFNRCVEQARGKYIYIATADDTMTVDCLEKLSSTLERQPDCGMAHCCLTFIDDLDNPLPDTLGWENWWTTRYYGELLKRAHLRYEGHDAIVALMLGSSVYYSMTQLLVRREIYSKTGPFREDFHSFADLEWQMRASLVTKTIHIPEYLATWRRHPGQASQHASHLKAVANGTFVRIARAIIEFSKTIGFPNSRGLPKRLLGLFRNERAQLRLESIMLRFSGGGLSDMIDQNDLAMLHRWLSSLIAWSIGNDGRNFAGPPRELKRLLIPQPRLVEGYAA